MFETRNPWAMPLPRPSGECKRDSARAARLRGPVDPVADLDSKLCCAATAKLYNAADRPARRNRVQRHRLGIGCDLPDPVVRPDEDDVQRYERVLHPKGSRVL